MIRNKNPSGIRNRPPETTDADVYVIGDGAVSVTVSRRFREGGQAVSIVDGSSESADVSAEPGDTTDASVLNDAGLDGASTVVVATSSDSRNLLAAQLIRSRFDVDRIIVVANDPGRVDAFADAGHEPLCATTVLADAIVDHV